MNCEILETLYVRSNGEIPCNDDAGEEVVLGRVGTEPGWSIAEELGASTFDVLRGKLGAGVEPWPQCARCAWLRPLEPFSDSLATRKIRKLQVEPSLLCNLCCPACSNQLQTACRPRPHLMALELFARLLESLDQGGYAVGEIEYCGQGEPLLHPKFSHFVALARELHADARQRVITNGNVDYAKATGREGIEEIYVSCDGARQTSYERYRIGGQVERALRFLRDAPRVENGVRQNLIWKYILFEFNDSDEEIVEAQHLAQELEVDAMVFVLTHSQYRSQRWDSANAGDLPILYPNVAASVTPVQERGHVGLRPLGGWKAPRFRRGLSFDVESIAASSGHLDCTGWASLPSGIEAIEVRIDRRRLGELRANLPRSDVAVAYPHVGPGAGFAGRVAATIPTGGIHSVEFVLRQPGGRGVVVSRRYRFGVA